MSDSKELNRHTMILAQFTDDGVNSKQYQDYETISLAMDGKHLMSKFPLRPLPSVLFSIYLY